MKFNADDVTLQVIDNRPYICFRFPVKEIGKCCSFVREAKELVKKYKDTQLTIGRRTEKRSLNANAYMWVLCTKLAEERSKDGVKVTKEDIYKEEIKDLGVWYDDEVPPNKVKWRCTAWSQIGTGWITERVDFTPDGTNEIIRFYYGSSRYNSKQMHRLIENLRQDCQAVGIETKTPDEIANLISLWESERTK